MADAAGTTVSVRLGAAAADGTDAEFAASGTTITFPGLPPGVRRIARRGGLRRDGRRRAGGAAAAARRRRRRGGRPPSSRSATPPLPLPASPRRRSIKRLEELGIGRPSTWASIIQTIQDRGYVWKKGQALVPTWTAFAVVNLLEQHFDELVDYEFTATIVETDLDAIAAGDRQKDQWLQAFYFGDEVLPGPEAAGRGEPRRDRCRRDQHLPRRRRRRRQRGRRQAGPVRALRQAGRGHGQRARRHGAGRADHRRRRRPAGGAEVRRADRPARRAARVRQERALRAVRPVGHVLPAPAGSREAEDVEPVKTTVLERLTMDDAEALLGLPRTLGNDPADGGADRRQQRALRPGRGRRARTTAAWRTRSSCSPSRSTTCCASSLSPRCSAAAARTWLRRARFGSSGRTP